MEEVSVLSLLGRLTISLAVVLALMAITAKVLRNRTMPGSGRAARPDTLQVVARQSLSRSASVTVVLAAGRALVLGVTDAGVSLLAEVEPSTLEPEPDDPAGAAPATWRSFLEEIRERTVRR